MAVQTQIQTRRGTAASWTSTNPTLAAGEFGYETDTGKFKIGNGSTAWAALAYTAAATAVTYLFNATSGQTTFSGADANGLTLAYTVGAEQVYLNGVLQVRGSDYTATNGTSIVLASGALTSDVLNVIAYSAMTITDTYTQAQADAKFVQQTNNFFAGKNKIINGDFNIWQRGTSFSNPTAGTFVADRYYLDYNGTVGTTTISQQTTPTVIATGVNTSSFLRWSSTVAGTGQSYNVLSQKIENVATFAEQTVTVSFYAKAAASTTLSQVYLHQNFGSGGSSEIYYNLGSATVTTSWARYSFTTTLGSLSGKTVGAGSFLRFFIGAPLNSTFTLDTWGWQIEAGSIATPFQTATGTIAGELAACQRYFWRHVPSYSSYGQQAFGFAGSTTSAFFTMPLPVTMRTTPTSIGTSTANTFLLNDINANTVVTGFTYDSGSSPNIGKFSVSVASGLTAYRPYNVLNNNNQTSYIQWDAEL